MEMKGFKSFANKTEILFGEKYNAVLGPNGSGKSNILDALVFVLGKSGAKGLRAEKTANLIYNGGKTKQPAKEAEVSIVFDNKAREFGEDLGDELVISRVISETKDGASSDYLINGKKRTRQEVVETLEKAKINPDGHNIILQGDIIHLIEMSGIERRQLIEEIAGIGVYEDKKEKALRELERVDQRLNETQIILAERETYLRELKSERDQAMKFRDLQTNLKRNKKTILLKNMARNAKEREKYEGAICKNGEEIAKLTGEIEQHQAGIREAKAEIEAVNREIERKGEKEQVQIHKEVEALKVERAVKRGRVEFLAGEIEKITQRRAQLLKDNQDLFDRIKYIDEDNARILKEIRAAQEELKGLDDRIKQFKKKHSVEDANRLDEQMMEIDTKAEKLQEELSKVVQERQDLLREKDRADIRIEQADERMRRVLEAQKANKAQLEQLTTRRDAFKAASKELQSALAQDATLAGQVQNSRQTVSRLTEELAKLQAQNAAIKEGAAGGAAIAKILGEKKRLKGIVGTVSELGSVKAEYQLAVEIAAGGRINSVVVEDDKTAAECIEFLRAGQHGVATFLPLNKLKAPEPDAKIKALAKHDGVVGLAIDLVSFDARYGTAFRFVLGNTLVVRSLDVARRIGIGACRMVTLDGDLVEGSGAMHGGYRERRRAGGFQQKEVIERISKLEAELGDHEAVLARVEQSRRDNEGAIGRLRARKAELEGEIQALEKTLHIDSADTEMNKAEKTRLQKESAEIEKKLDAIIERTSEANRDLAALKTRKQQLRDEITQMRSPTVLAQLASFDEKRSSLVAQITELEGQRKANAAQVQSVLGPETERTKQILKGQEKEIVDFTKERQEAIGKIAVIEEELKVKEEAERKFLTQFKDLFKKREIAARKVDDLEKDVGFAQVRTREFDGKNAAAGIELARVKAEFAGLEEEDRQFGNVEPFDGKKEEDCLVEIRQFERMLEEIGAVNMRALDMYETVEREYTALVQKKEKLGLERQDVLVMINEIDSRKKEIFMTAFDILNQNFIRIFTSLSPKGEAFLEIDDDERLFESGVAIKVRLTGKKFMDIRSLSGGEKTMTALSFLFAVQEHEPAHFYVLDEVDAALDKHNSEKLAKLIRAYCRNAQYIVVSHNDAIISEADNLYGVAMNEHGISKITSLKV